MEVMLLVSFKIQENELKKYMIDISKGNELALEQFYEKYGQLLLALIYSIVKNRESSEEALQDVLMAIVNRNADNPMENARGWLFKVIENISKKKVKEDKLMHSVYPAAKTARARTFNRTCTDSEPQFST